MKNLFVSLGALSFLAACTPTEKQPEIRSLSVDELAVAVTPQENREYSYTDKRQASGTDGRIRMNRQTGMPDGTWPKNVSFRIMSCRLTESRWYVRKPR